MGNDFMDMLSGDMPEKKQSSEKGAGDLLGSLLGGAGGGGGGDLGSLLGGLMGGGAAPAQPASGGGGDLLGSLLGGLAGNPAGAAGMGGLLGGLLGGSGVSLPFAGVLAEKLGISEQMANTLIMGAMGLLASSAAKNKGKDRSGGVNFDALADPDFIRSSGVSSQLSDQMGLSEDEVVGQLQKTLGLMAASQEQPAPTKAAPAKKAAAPKKSPAKSTKSAPKK